MARFCTLADVAAAYRLAPGDWLAAVVAAAAVPEEEMGQGDGEESTIDPDQ